MERRCGIRSLRNTRHAVIPVNTAVPAGLSLNGTDAVWSADVSYSVQRRTPSYR